MELDWGETTARESCIMISQCANRDCAVQFHYMRGGHLYRFDLKSPAPPCTDVPNAICSEKPLHATVFFWLCEPCSSRYSLRFNRRDGVQLVALPASATRPTTAPVVAVTTVGTEL